MALALVLLAGCGSKINEANYSRVQNGMDEEDVVDLLGPAQHESSGTEGAATGAAMTSPASAPTSAPAASRPLGRKVKTWTRGGLRLSVVFEGGKVVERSAEGIPFEGSRSRAAGAAPAPHNVSTTPR